MSLPECVNCARHTAACEQCETCENYYCPDCLYFHECKASIDEVYDRVRDEQIVEGSVSGMQG